MDSKHKPKQATLHYREEDLYSEASALDTDFRAESLVAALIEAGYDPDKLLVVRQGDVNKHNISKDIDRIEKKFALEDLTEYFYVYTNRASMYDSLPEYFFHQSKNKEDALEELRRHRQEEFYARRYFKPLEMAVDETLVDIQLHESRFDKKNVNPKLTAVFEKYWTILKLFNLRQTVFFLEVLPIFGQINQSFELMSEVMTVILGTNVQITGGEKTAITLTRDQAGLDDCILDEDFVLDDHSQDGTSAINIHVGPASIDQMRSFEGGKLSNQILGGLLSWMLPELTQTNLTYTMSDEDSGFRLSDEDHNCYLGLNTVLYE